MKTINLSQNKIAMVDDEDFEFLNLSKWCASRYRNSFRAARHKTENGKQTTIYMHREILNAQKDIQVDHRNGDGLDNQKHNLRLATNQQNQFNKRYAQKSNKLKIKGVRWDKRRNKFYVRRRANHGKSI